MQLTIIHENGFPRLSWVAIFDSNADKVIAYVGSDVEVFENGFIEGCHTGKHILNDVLESKFCLATGLIVKDNNPIFFSATHTLDPLFYIECDDLIYISNSLVGVLALSNHELDENYFYYADDFSTIKDHNTQIKLKAGILNVVHRADLKILPDKKKEIFAKLDYGPFPDYHSYESSLIDAANDILRNAQMSERKIKYNPIATLSSGYDSTAVTAIIKTIAPDLFCKVLTIRDAGKNLGDTNDSGVPIANELGLEAIEVGRMDYKSNTENEVLFSVMGAPQDMPMGSFTKHFAGTLHLRGDAGDFIWVYNVKPGNYTRQMMSGLNTNEFRLRSGFINFPLPFVGIDHHADIIRIAKSDELADWRLNNEYDRPIARRLAENRGVSRHLFGQQKKATVVSSLEDNYFSDNLVQKLNAKWSTIKNAQRKQIFLANLKTRLFWIQGWLINKYVSVRRRLGNKTFDFKRRFISRRYAMPASKWSVLSQWATESLKQDYKLTTNDKPAKEIMPYEDNEPSDEAQEAAAG